MTTQNKINFLRSATESTTVCKSCLDKLARAEILNKKVKSLHQTCKAAYERQPKQLRQREQLWIVPNDSNYETPTIDLNSDLFLIPCDACHSTYCTSQGLTHCDRFPNELTVAPSVNGELIKIYGDHLCEQLKESLDIPLTYYLCPCGKQNTVLDKCIHVCELEGTYVVKSNYKKRIQKLYKEKPVLLIESPESFDLSPEKPNARPNHSKQVHFATKRNEERILSKFSRKHSQLTDEERISVNRKYDINVSRNRVLREKKPQVDKHINKKNFKYATTQMFNPFAMISNLNTITSDIVNRNIVGKVDSIVQDVKDITKPTENDNLLTKIMASIINGVSGKVSEVTGKKLPELAEGVLHFLINVIYDLVWICVRQSWSHAFEILGRYALQATVYTGIKITGDKIMKVMEIIQDFISKNSTKAISNNPRMAVTQAASGAALGAIVLPIIGLFFFDRVTSSREQGDFMTKISTKGRSFANIWQGKKAMKEMLEEIKECIVEAIEFILGAENVPVYMVSAQKKFHARMSELIKDYATISNPMDLKEIQGSEAYRTWILKLRKEADDLFIESCTSKQDGSVRQLLGDMRRQIANLADTAHIVKEQSALRLDPFCLSLYSPPGVGKSTIMPDIVETIISEGEYDHSNAVYTRPIIAKHEDLYYGQAIAIIDDQFMSQDGSDEIFFACAKSCAVYAVLKAALIEKGTQFTSEVVLTATNTPYPEPKAMTCQEALWRRRNSLWSVRRNPEFKGTPSPQDIKECPHLQFAQLDPLDSSSLARISEESWVDYKVFKTTFVAEFHTYMNRQCDLLARAPKNIGKIHVPRYKKGEVYNFLLTRYSAATCQAWTDEERRREHQERTLVLIDEISNKIMPETMRFGPGRFKNFCHDMCNFFTYDITNDGQVTITKEWIPEYYRQMWNIFINTSNFEILCFIDSAWHDLQFLPGIIQDAETAVVEMRTKYEEDVESHPFMYAFGVSLGILAHIVAIIGIYKIVKMIIKFFGGMSKMIWKGGKATVCAGISAAKTIKSWWCAKHEREETWEDDCYEMQEAWNIRDNPAGTFQGCSRLDTRPVKSESNEGKTRHPKVTVARLESEYDLNDLDQYENFWIDSASDCREEGFDLVSRSLTRYKESIADAYNCLRSKIIDVFRNPVVESNEGKTKHPKVTIAKLESQIDEHYITYCERLIKKNNEKANHMRALKQHAVAKAIENVNTAIKKAIYVNGTEGIFVSDYLMPDKHTPPPESIQGKVGKVLAPLFGAPRDAYAKWRNPDGTVKPQRVLNETQWAVLNSEFYAGSVNMITYRSEDVCLSGLHWHVCDDCERVTEHKEACATRADCFCKTGVITDEVKQWDFFRRISKIPYLAETQGSCDMNALTMTHQIQGNCVLLETLHGATRGLMLKGNYMLVNRHFMDLHDGQKVKITSNGLPYVVQIRKKDCFDFDKVEYEGEEVDRDALIWKVGSDITRLPSFPDITSYFIREADICKINGCPIAMVVKSHEEAEIRTVDNCEQIQMMMAMNEGVNQNVIYYTHRALAYKMPTQAGDCGSPIILFNKNIVNKIYGIHTSGRQQVNTGFAMCISREMLEYMFGDKVVVQGRDEHPPLARPENWLNKCHLYPPVSSRLWGLCPKGEEVFQSDKTAVLESEIHGMVREPVTAPAVLSDKDPRMGPNAIPPLERAVAKEGANLPLMDLDIMEEISDFFIEEEKTALDGLGIPRVLTDFETINGVGSLERMNMNTSAGYPYVYEKTPEKGKKAYFDQGEDGNYTIREGTSLAKDLRECEASYKEGFIPGRNCFIYGVKDERRKLKKIEDGNSRIFTICGAHYGFMMRKYYGGYIAAMMDANYRVSQAVGTDALGPDWTTLCNFMKEVGSKFLPTGNPEFSSWFDSLPQAQKDTITKVVTPTLALDYENFDAHQMADVLMANVREANAWYRYQAEKHGHPWNPEDDIVRQALLEEGVHKNMKIANIVMGTTSGLPSGIPGTSHFNGRSNRRYTRYAWIKIMDAAKRVDLRPLGMCNKLTRSGFYGDDLLMTVSKNILHLYNGVSISNALKEYGIKVTSAQKGEEITPCSSIRDVTFLKRKFRTHERYSDIQKAPIDEDVIFEIINWTRKSKYTTNVDATLENCEGALAEAYHHGRVFFDDLKSRICAALSEKKIDHQPFDRYEDYDRKFLAKFDKA